MPRPSRFSIELDPKRRKRWQLAADLAIPSRQRNVAPWLVPLVDMLAEIQLSGRDPGVVLKRALGEDYLEA